MFGFGKLLGNQAAWLDLERADECISLTDGAPWIRNRILEHVPSIDAMLLDFYHFSEHIWEAAKCCFSDPQEAKTWAEDRLREIKETGPMAVLDAIKTLNKTVRAASKKESLRLLRGYITERFEMLDYRRGVGPRLGHRFRPHRSHVQEPDTSSQANGHEVGFTQRGRLDEPGGPPRK